MKMALNSKRKLGFVDGSIPKPDADADPDLIAAWQCNNDIVFSWLLNLISKDIVESMIYADSATMLWRNLHAIPSSQWTSNVWTQAGVG